MQVVSLGFDNATDRSSSKSKPLIAQFAGGLTPIPLGDDAALSLVIKTQKEPILAAKMNGSFAFYLPALRSGLGRRAKNDAVS